MKEYRHDLIDANDLQEEMQRRSEKGFTPLRIFEPETQEFDGDKLIYIRIIWEREKTTEP